MAVGEKTKNESNTSALLPVSTCGRPLFVEHYVGKYNLDNGKVDLQRLGDGKNATVLFFEKNVVTLQS